MRGITISAAAITLPWAGHQAPFSPFPAQLIILYQPIGVRNQQVAIICFVCQRIRSSVVDPDQEGRFRSALFLEAGSGLELE
jgi:hypothetical protein